MPLYVIVPIIAASIPLLAWGMWLLYCYAIARLLGAAGLKTALGSAAAFRAAGWATAVRLTSPSIAARNPSATNEVPVANDAAPSRQRPR